MSSRRVPKEALELKDIKVDMVVVRVWGGSYYHEAFVIKSKPYKRNFNIADPDKPGNMINISSTFIKVCELGKAASTEISTKGEGASKHITEYSAVDMGLCTDYKGEWGGAYCVLRSEYNPRKHSS